MGAALKLDIHGEKGGSSSPKAPSEAADSLRSTNLAKLLIAVGEGEFEGTPTAADIYLDNTPIQDASGNVNFPNVKWDWRPGSVDQTYIPGIPSVDNETTVNVELRSDAAWVRSITNTQLSAVRVRLAWPALQKQDNEGNVSGYRIEYVIDVATDGGSYQQVLSEAVDGKTTTRYERSRRIDLPAATSGWQIRVRRLTPNQNTNRIADTMLVAGLTEVIDAKLRYPNTALLYIEFDAEQFTNIPAVTVRCKARKWQVPSNYDPINRTYSGVWDGTMKQAWTNNPAWVTYGICTEDRFGLGKRIKSFMVDKWELYRIAQYCDQLVPNGVGGQEPRFLCDMNLQGRAEAWSLLRDIAGIYRGMTYWAQGQLVMQADMPRAQDFDYVFTRANVIDGKFSYGSASAKTRYTRALVSYDNPDNNYDTDVIPFADLDMQRRFGDKPTELSAIGCTRASEAQRRGKWVVLSNNQDRTVTFKTGMEGAIPLPGHIIPIADTLLAGREVGGRITAAAGKVVTLDRDTQAKPGDRLIVNLPGGKAEGRTVESVAGRALTVTTAYSETPIPQLQWALDADDLAIPLYRVLSTRRSAEGEYEISALQYEPSKFAYIDTGARLEERPISVIPITVVAAPASVSLTSTTAIAQGLAVTTMTISWPAVSGAVAYDVEWRKDNGNWIKVQRTGSTSVDVTGIYAGGYLARVRAVSAFDISSNWRTSILTQLKGKEGLPPAVTSLTALSLIFGIRLNWTFPPGAEDTQRTEIWYSPNTSLESATKLSDLAYPQSEYQMQGLLAGVTFFFWARLVDKTGNIGPWYPVGAGVMGQSSSDAAPVLELIAGKIGETELGQDLLDKIGLIDGPPTLPGSVNSRLTELSEQVTEITGQLQGQIDQIADLADSMPYKDDKIYVSGQGVLGADGIIYQATKDVPIHTPPPNATYWLNVGQAVQTAAGLAARVTTVETKVTDQTGELTAQAERIDGVQSSLTGKADASTVTSIGNRVTEAEGKLTSQGQAITGVQNSLAGKADASTVSNLSNTVSQHGIDLTAQGQALTNVQASVAGISTENLVPDPTFAAGKTAVQNLSAVMIVPRSDPSAPAAAPSTRLAKWAVATLTGNTYVVWGVRAEATSEVVGRLPVAAGEVYEVSVDIFMEAGSGTRLFSIWVQNYDASGASIQHGTISSSTTRGQWVTLSGKITIPATVTTMRPTIRVGAGEATNVWMCNQRWVRQSAADAAQASATQAIDARVTQTETTLTSHGSAITNIDNALPGKADSSALQSLASTVTQQGTTLTSQGTAVTQLQSTVGDIGGAGSNLLNDIYSWLTSTALPPTSLNAATAGGVAVAGAISGYGYKLTALTASSSAYAMLCPSNNDAGWNIPVEAGTYIVSFYASTPAAATVRVRLYSATVGAYSATIPLTTSRARYSVTVTLSAASKVAVLFYFNMSAVSGTEVTVDSVMVEKQIGTSTSPSPFVAGSSASTASGQATAISSLDTRVTNTEGAVNAQASRLDGIYVQVNPALAGDTAGFAGATTSFVGVWSEQSARIEDGVATGKRIDTVQAEVNSASAAVQTTSKAVADLEGKASATWSVKLQVTSQGQYVAAGIGLGIENTGAGLQSQFLVSADRFAVVSSMAGGAISVPFAVQNGQVFINSAFIQDGTITNAKIGSYISSTNYIAGQLGWILNKDGTFEINSPLGGGGRQVINSQGGKVFDANGVKRYQWGNLDA